MILVKVGMHCLSNPFSSFVEMMYISHDLVVISIMSLYRLVFHRVANFSSLDTSLLLMQYVGEVSNRSLIIQSCSGRTVQTLLLGLCQTWPLVEDIAPCFLLVH